VPETLDASQGLRMANEVGEAEMAAVTRAMKLGPDEEFIALYNVSGPGYRPEMAVLTSGRLAYIKDNRLTDFPLKELEDVADNDAYTKRYGLSATDPNHFLIEARSRKGGQMRIKIGRTSDGPPFYRSILDAWKRADPEAAKAIEAKAKSEPKT